ncbi:hypothetical protein DFP73DRAFT_366815 [Morchella snyderi]|nr:hypothetical protein DFP73DRAFT_366815 [Morchella snyderi]
MSQTLTPMLSAMVICRGLARFIGYPPLHDPTFTNTPLLHSFSAALDARAQSHTLWHLTPTDVSAIFTPLLDYAERRPRLHAALNPADIALMQTRLTFAAAHALATEIDALARGAPAPSWERWFALVRRAQRIHGGVRAADADVDVDVDVDIVCPLLSHHIYTPAQLTPRNRRPPTSTPSAYHCAHHHHHHHHHHHAAPPRRPPPSRPLPPRHPPPPPQKKQQQRTPSSPRTGPSPPSCAGTVRSRCRRGWRACWPGRRPRASTRTGSTVGGMGVRR